mmetsp:Transcript_129857/g.290318  ORF Transcript_129857/g.290318 Transcript_129857/m.290318 type:complete len:276 (+) Transcript_129857:714-1541(+)
MWIVRDRGHATGHLLKQKVGARRTEADQGPLHHVRSVWIATQLDDVFLQGRHQKALLLARADQANERLQRMGAPLIGGNCTKMLRGHLQHAQALRYGASLEGGGAEIVPIHVSHDIGQVPLDAIDDVCDDAWVPFEQLPLQELAARLRLRHLHHDSLCEALVVLPNSLRHLPRSSLADLRPAGATTALAAGATTLALPLAGAGRRHIGRVRRRCDRKALARFAGGNASGGRGCRSDVLRRRVHHHRKVVWRSAAPASSCWAGRPVPRAPGKARGA